MVETEGGSSRCDFEEVADHLAVRIPRRACCLEHRAPFDAFADAYFARPQIVAVDPERTCDRSDWFASR